VGIVARFRARARARGIFLRESLPKVAAILDTGQKTVSKTAATLDSDFLRKIPREKFRTEINTPRARENVRQF
jgi:hypothetical protein